MRVVSSNQRIIEDSANFLFTERNYYLSFSQGKPTLAVTIAAWVKARNVTGPNVNEIFMTEAPGVADPTKQGQYHFEILDKGRVRFFQRNMDKTVYGRTTREGIPGNTWVHLAGVYNPASKQALIYINGRPIMDYEQTDAQETDSLGTDWSKAAYIGTFTDDQGLPRQFKGALDEFYIFPCALSGIQIAKLKDTHKMRKFHKPLKTQLQIFIYLQPFDGVECKKLIHIEASKQTLLLCDSLIFGATEFSRRVFGYPVHKAKLLKRSNTFKVNEVTITIMSERHTNQSELL